MLSAGPLNEVVQVLYTQPDGSTALGGVLGRVNMKLVKATLGIVILASVIFAASAAFGSSAPSTRAGGSINAYLSTNSSGGGSILITGAIGDYGRTTLISGQKGVSLVKLHKGTFELKGNTPAVVGTPTVNSTTCSYSHSQTARETVLDGTGLYAGISGTLNITVSYARVDTPYTSGGHKGQCDLNLSAVPYSQFDAGIGTGTVSFG